MDLNKDFEHVLAEAVRKMPDAHLVELIRTQLHGDTVPEPEPRRKGRKMRKAVPAKMKARKRRTKKPKVSPNETKALGVILKARSPLTVQDIAKKMKMRPDSIRPILKAMADQGLIGMTGEGQGEKRVSHWLFSAK